MQFNYVDPSDQPNYANLFESEEKKQVVDSPPAKEQESHGQVQSEINMIAAGEGMGWPEPEVVEEQKMAEGLPTENVLVEPIKNEKVDTETKFSGVEIVEPCPPVNSLNSQAVTNTTDVKKTMASLAESITNKFSEKRTKND